MSCPRNTRVDLTIVPGFPLTNDYGALWQSPRSPQTTHKLGSYWITESHHNLERWTTNPFPEIYTDLQYNFTMDYNCIGMIVKIRGC